MADDFDPIEIRAGETPEVPLAFVRSDGTTPVSLSGATVTLKATRGTGGGETVFSRTATVTDAAGGLASVVLTATDTATPGRYALAARAVEQDGTVTIAAGLLIIKDHALR